MKNERKTVEEKGVKKRKKWEDFEGEKWEKGPRRYVPSIARYQKNEFLEVPDLKNSRATRVAAKQQRSGIPVINGTRVLSKFSLISSNPFPMRFPWMKEVSRKGHKPLTIRQSGGFGMA